MTGKELLFGLGELDDALLDEAISIKPQRRHISGWIAMAACAALIVAASVPYALLFFGRTGSAAPTQETATTTECAPEETTEVSEQNGVFQPSVAQGADVATLPEATQRKMIQDYHFEPDMEVCYAVPKNGDVGISAHLQGAIDEYGEEPIYRVLIDLFSDEKQVELTDEVLDSVTAELTENGYTVAIEKAYLWDEPTGVYLTIHATADQVRNFPPLEQYGVMLFLFGERAPIGDEIGTVLYSSGINSAE